MAKNKKMVVGIVALLFMVILAAVVFYHIDTGLSFNNQSENLTIASTQYNTIGDLFLAVLVSIIAAAIIIVLYTLAVDIKGFDRFSRIWRFLAKSGYYFLWGSALLIIVIGPIASFYYTWEYMSANPGTAGSFIDILTWIFILLGVFFGIAIFGKFIGEPVLRKIQENYKKHKEAKT